MPSINQHIEFQGFWLKSKGYKHTVLNNLYEPELMLSKLRKTLNDFNTTQPNYSRAVPFSLGLLAEFQNGKYPTQFLFNYTYQPNTEELALRSIDASMFDNTINYNLVDRALIDLPSSTIVLKDLKIKNLLNVQKHFAQFKRRVSNDNKRIRLR